MKEKENETEQGSGLTGAEMVTGIVREMTERSLGRGNHMNNENHVNPVMTGLGRESERGTEEIARRRKRGNGRGQGIGRSQRKVIEEVEVETDHLTDERAGSPDILRIVPQSGSLLDLLKARVKHLVLLRTLKPTVWS